MGAQQLAHDRDVLDVVDPHEDDREVARDALRPERRRPAAAAANRVGGRTQRRIGVEHVAGETLKEAGLLGVDAEIAQLHLRLGPRQRGRAVEGGRVLVLVDQVQHLAAGRRDDRPERDAHRAARRHPHATTQREDGIEDGADGVRKRPAVHHRDRRPDVAAAAEEAGAVGFDLRLAHRLAFDDGEVRRPDLGLAGRATTPRREDGAVPGEILGLHEELGEGRVRRVGGGRREHEFGVRRELDVPRAAARIRDRDAPNLGVVLRRDDDLERRRDRPVVPDELGAILGERDVVAVRLHAARLVAGGPHVPGLHVAQEDVAPPVVAGDVLAPARDAEIAPAAVPGAGARQHHRVPAVREQVHLRRGGVRGAEPPHRRQLEVADRRRRR